MLLFLAGAAATFLIVRRFPSSDGLDEVGIDPKLVERASQKAARIEAPRKFEFGQLTLWWDAVPKEVRRESVRPDLRSNIHPSDYAGIETCGKCHPQQHSQWLGHAHRLMNARATNQTVVGDFGGTATITYKGGTGTFLTTDDGHYEMELRKGDIVRRYRITQTIGSRFFQYYVGQQTEGPEPTDHKFYHEEHVLPFGYWIDEREWVPTVHIGDEVPDSLRPDPFESPPEEPKYYQRYGGCNMCHTTFPFGDMFVRNGPHLGNHAEGEINWNLGEYISRFHPDLLSPHQESWELSNQELRKVAEQVWQFEAAEHAVDFGITCEACHLGCAEHVATPSIKPKFAPFSEYLFSGEIPSAKRTHRNLNAICGRCHIGERPTLAAGMSTWNSTEHADAMKGSCYSQLTCVHCHNPHQGIGKKWQKSPDADDQSCLACHAEYTDSLARERHTHHSWGSAGSRCLNCHMPHLNEGLQDVVRTHMISSPTNARMIHANQPNACNLCHLEESINWTIGHLENWYGKTFDTSRIEAAYRDRSGSTGKEWFHHPNEAVRLIASGAATRTGAIWALPELIRLLNDPYLINRQLTQRGVEEMLDVNLRDFGYRFYLSEEERRAPLEKIRHALIEQAVPSQSEVSP
ncbi:MAG: hypothetical protein KDA80_04655 [Planctomycetaceae bacterium]|nr:hypothetical protein [Planctomycetaceae bacterium]